MMERKKIPQTPNGFSFKLSYFGYIIFLMAFILGLTFRNESHKQESIGSTRLGEPFEDDIISDELKQTIQILGNLTKVTHPLGSYENEVEIPKVINSYIMDFISNSEYLAPIASSIYFLCVNDSDTKSKYFDEYCQIPLDDKDFKINLGYFIQTEVIEGIKAYLKPYIELSDGPKCSDAGTASNLFVDNICSGVRFPIQRTILLPHTSRYFNRTNLLEEHEIPLFCQDLIVFDLSFYDDYSGTFTFDNSAVFTIYYSNLAGMAMRITPFSLFDVTNGPAMVPSVMVTSHYDSGWQSPGGSDAGSCVAIGMETMRSFLHENSSQIKASLLFYFNGAEESLLLGAHGFAKLHPWSRMIASFINLEALGNSGKEALFQLSDKHEHLIRLYSQSIDKPSTQSLSTGFFNLGIVPSITDYWIYKDIYQIGGVDFALIEECYVYHTTLDKSSSIPLETLEHYLNTIKTLTMAIGNDVGKKITQLRETVIKGDTFQTQEFYNSFPYSKAYETPEKYNFFDLFGTYTILIPTTFEIPLCIAVIILWIFSFYFSNKILGVNPGLLFIKHFIFLMIYCAAVMLINYSISSILDLTNSGFFFFSQPILTTLLYSFSSFVVIYIFQYTIEFDTTNSKYSLKLEQADFNAFICLWAYLLMLCMLFSKQISALYIPLSWLLFGLSGRLFALFIISIFSYFQKSTDHFNDYRAAIILTFFQTVFLTTPCLLTLKIARTFLLILIPLQGRTAKSTFPIGGNISIFLTLTSLIILIPYLSTFRFVDRKLRQQLRGPMYLTLVLLITFIYLRSNYVNHFTSSSPKRLIVTQAQIYTQFSNGTQSNQRSGILIQPLDAYGLKLPPSSSFSIEEAILSQLSKNHQNDNIFVDKIKYSSDMKFDWPISIATSNPGFVYWISYPFPQEFSKVKSFITNNNNKEDYTLGITNQHEHLVYERKWNNTSSINSIPTTVEWMSERSNSTGNKLITLKISADYNLKIAFPSRDLISWSLSDKLPREHPSCKCHLILASVGRGNPIFTFQVEYPDTVQTLEFSTTNNLSYLTPDMIEISYGKTFPDWLDILSSNIQTTHWVINLD